MFLFYLLLLPGAFFAPVIHEWVKARVSAKLGDPTPKRNGFITWNPIKFFEPIGFFFMMYFQLGWGQPVTTSPFYYKDKRKGIALTYIAPMAANLLAGMLALTLLSIVRVPLHNLAIEFGAPAATAMALSLTNGTVAWRALFPLIYDAPFWFYIVLGVNQAVFLFAEISIGLAIFNLVPIYPMGMSRLMNVFVSPETTMRMNHHEKMLQMLLCILLFFGILQPIIFPIRNAIMRTIMF